MSKDKDPQIISTQIHYTPLELWNLVTRAGKERIIPNELFWINKNDLQTYILKYPYQKPNNAKSYNPKTPKMFRIFLIKMFRVVWDVFSLSSKPFIPLKI